MSQLDKRYSTFSSFIAFIYRNGLLHQHQPKRFQYKNKDLGWWFSIVSPNNPIDIQRKYHLVINKDTLMIDMNVFYFDVIQSIDIALGKILKGTKKEFQASYRFQNKPLTKHYLLSSRKKNRCRYIFLRDFKFVEQFG